MPQDACADVSRASAWRSLLLPAVALLYMGLSAGLINFNKYLITPGRFPYPACTVFFHMVASSIFSGVLYVLKPNWFPARTDPERRVEIDTKVLQQGIAPVAMAFSASLVLSNAAYFYGNVAFLQMVKESNVVLVYALSLVAGLEVFKGRNVAILFAIVVATWVSIDGQVNFSVWALLIQGSACLFECSKIVMQALLLSPSGKKLDPMTYTLVVSPACALVLGVSLVVLNQLMPSGIMALPSLADVWRMWPYLLANCSIAVLLNLVVALFIQLAQGVIYILAGVLKDAMIVFLSVFFVGDTVSRQQCVGFGSQLTLIMFYSMMKAFPKEFEDGIVVCLCRRIGYKEDHREQDATSALHGKTADGAQRYGGP